MPRLFVLSGPDVGKSVAFEREVDLGRSPDVAVVLRSPSVSRRHARILREGGRWWLEDLGSVNGTTIAGKSVSREQLADGSLFQLGDLELRFRLEAGAGEGSSTTVLEGDESQVGEGPDVPAPARTDPDEVELHGVEIDPVELDAAEAGEFELEGDWDESVPAPARPAVTPPAPGSPGAAPDPGPVRAGESPAAGARAAARAQLEATQVRRGARTTTSGGRILQYKNVANREGFLSADLGQYPLWVRATVTLLLIALFLGLTWGAYQLTAKLRGRGSGDVNLESTP